MDNSRDSSLLRSLAVAFGDGLAFGVGMKLTQSAPGKPGSPVQPDVAGRLARIEQRVERMERAPAAIGGPAGLDRNTIEALTHALEARLQEAASLADRGLAELELKLAAELSDLHRENQALASGSETRAGELHQQLDQQVQALRRQANEDRSALQNQVVALHREFAAAVADIVEEQVASQVEERVAGAVSAQMAVLEQQLREEIRQASAAKHREIADLRQRITESDRNVLDVLLTVGDLFRNAAGRHGAPNAPAGFSPAPPAAEAPSPAAEAAPEDPQEAPRVEATPVNGQHTDPEAPEASASYAEIDLPEFLQPRKAAAAWSVPLVTSFLVTAGCVLVLQYL